MNEPGFGRALLIGAGVLVAGTLVAALWVMDSPSTQRARRIDQRRVAQLQAIASAVDQWTLERRTLPPSLAGLAHQPGRGLTIVDPVDGRPYDYQPTSADGYRLCATFATSTADNDRTRAGRWAGEVGGRWLHPAGHFCFQRKVEQGPLSAQPAR